MTTQDTVNRLKENVLNSAAIKTYSKDDVICFGWVPEIRLWRLMHQFKGMPSTMIEASAKECDKLLDEAFTAIEAKGMRLLIVVDNKVMPY